MAAAIIRKREAAKSSTKAPDTGAQDVGHDDNPGTGSNDLTRNVEKFI